MPTARHYGEAATELRRLAARVEGDWRTVGIVTDPDRITGGPLAAVLHDRLDAAVRALAGACGELDRLALACERRAADADQGNHPWWTAPWPGD